MFQNPRKQKSVLAIDRGSKYIGLAYETIGQTVVFPVGYILNDQMVYYNIAEVIERHNVSTIVIWRPNTQVDIQDRILKFIQSMKYIIGSREITIERVIEDYTSVQAGEIVSNFKKNAAEDTISAMLILERWNKKEGEVPPLPTEDLSWEK